MTPWVALGTNLIGIAVLAYLIYFRRYYRRDLLLSYVALNVGVFALSAVLVGASAGAGLGLGLFGVLSILRLRSDSVTQEEIGCYFVALAMGLVNGLHPGPIWLAPLFTGMLVAVIWVVDHPRLTARSLRHLVTLDRAYPDRGELRAALERLLGGQVRYFVVSELDFVRDLTIVDVRFRAPRPGKAAVTPVPAPRQSGEMRREVPATAAGAPGEMPDELCTQCGGAMRPEQRFCGSCGRERQEVA